MVTAKSISGYEILCFKRNRCKGAVAHYVRNDLSYTILSFFLSEIENIFFETLLFKWGTLAVTLIIYQGNSSYNKNYLSPFSKFFSPKLIERIQKQC